MIPVSEPVLGDAEIEAVLGALRRGEISGSFGEAIPRFEQEFAAAMGAAHGVATTSGTTALHLAVAAAGIGAGDEVLVSSSTNIATALAIVHNRALPVPVDSEEDSWNIDLDLIEPLITERTLAIMPVHLFGAPVDMDRLMAIADRYSLIVIEDCAQAHGAEARGRRTGTFGQMGCFSFYANKIITTGEGGMVTTDDPDLADRLRLLRNLGFTEPRFRHEVLGFNFRMTGMQAAIGLAQLRRFEDILVRKRSVAAEYTRRLAGLRGLKLPHEPEWARHVYWMYALEVMPEAAVSRDELQRALHAGGIETRTFFCPLGQQPCLLNVPGFRPPPSPVADRIWRSGLYLPSAPTLTEDHIAQVTDVIRACLE